MTSVFSLLVRLALQSVLAHKRKSLIVGGLMGFGAFLVVMGTALLSSVESSMRTSIVSSVTGDIQVYDKDAKDPLALFGGFGFGTEDIGEIPSFQAIAGPLLQIENVRAVVPMGIANGTVSTPGDLDRALEALRDAVRVGDVQARDAAAARVRRLASILAEQKRRNAEVSETAEDREAEAILARATSEALWAELATEPLAVLDELDAKLAPLGEQGQIIYLRMIGTDLEAFQREFDKMKIVSGRMVPPGERGLLIGQKFLDRRVKMVIAMNLDTLGEELGKGKTIAADKVLQETVAKNVRLHARILYDLSPADAAAVEAELRAALPPPATDGGAGASAADGARADLPALLQELLRMDDTTFAARRKIFDDVVAPRIQLYPFKVGDTITLTSFTKTGYLRSVNLKIWGTYAFEGLESSDLAGALSLVDLSTFRDLYGQRTAELDAELLAMKKDVGAAQLSREEAEAALFGGEEAAAPEEAPAPAPGRDEAEAAAAPVAAGGGESDLVLSAAVLLKDPERIEQTLAAINARGDELKLQAVDWQRAAGLIGQFVWVIRGVLTIAILIIFAVAIVIINNSMVMATLERVAEIGTMRAIGAKKGFVTLMIILETTVLGILAGGIGTLAAAAVVSWLHRAGIPAGNDILVFLFAGPKLFPTVSAENMALGIVATVVVSVAATLYPARLATAIQPVVAMQGKE
jgi:ABC-type lipoprotein release transport system permease subunit